MAQRRMLMPRRRAQQLPAGALALIDILLIIVALLVFALFDHVIPRAGQTAVYSAPSATIAPLPVEEQQSVEAQDAAPQDVETNVTVGDFSEKFADLFTDGEVVRTETSYRSASLNITVSRYETKIGNYDQAIFVEDIYIRSIDCLRTVFAQDTFGKAISEDVTSMSQRVNAVAAINSDYYGYGNAGIVIRNGVLYRREFEPGEEVLIIYRDGDMKVYRSQAELDIDQAMADGAWQSFSFGPSFLDSTGDIRSEGYQRVNHDPRTIIGMVEPGHYLFIVLDGRQKGYADGMTYAECARLCKELGCAVAYNLDGGRTSQMTFLGAMVNQPYKNGRPTSDIVCVVDLAA